MLSEGAVPVSAFEQAFTATFISSRDSEEVSRTLEQFAWLANWIDKTPQPNATQLAFAPEFANASVLALARAGVALAKRGDKVVAAMKADLVAIADRLRGLSPWRGYPVTRRVLLGALVQRRVGFGGRFPLELAPHVDGVMLQLFRLHTLSSANRGAVQFFHVSKSGGTNLCQAAEANGCASQGFDERTNCLIRAFSDQPRWVSYNAHKYLQHRMSARQQLPWFVNFHSFRPELSCEQRRAFLQRLNLTFYANEYANPPGMESPSTMCDDFVNLLMFRDPTERLRSQIGWVQKLYREWYTDVDAQAAFVNRTSGFWERLMPAAVNNYYTRSLLGQRFFEFPVAQVGPEHVEWSHLAVASHDVLLSLPDAPPPPSPASEAEAAAAATGAGGGPGGSGGGSGSGPRSRSRNEDALRVGLGWAAQPRLREGAVRSSVSELGALRGAGAGADDGSTGTDNGGSDGAPGGSGGGVGGGGGGGGGAGRSPPGSGGVALPLDWDALVERNAPDVRLYGFAVGMQALDSLLWSFADPATTQLGGGASSAGGDAAAASVGMAGSVSAPGAGPGVGAGACGYVSMASPAALAERLTRLRSVAIPDSLLVAATGMTINDGDADGDDGGGDGAGGGSPNVTAGAAAGAATVPATSGGDSPGNGAVEAASAAGGERGGAAGGGGGAGPVLSGGPLGTLPGGGGGGASSPEAHRRLQVAQRRRGRQGTRRMLAGGAGVRG